MCDVAILFSLIALFQRRDLNAFRVHFDRIWDDDYIVLVFMCDNGKAGALRNIVGKK